MRLWRKVVLIFAVTLLFVTSIVWLIVPQQKGPMLSVTLAGFTNNPVRGVTPAGRRIEVCYGAAGTCALFEVRNVTSNQFLWFKTASLERKTEKGWERVDSIEGVWSGVEGNLWSPGYACLYAVGWPPGLPTNATWRLQVRHGKDPSLLARLINQKIGRDIFRSGKQKAVVASDAVELTDGLDVAR